MDARDKPAAGEAILLRRDADSVAWLTLNRPAARNALSVALMSALENALAAVARDTAVKVVVIGANGPGFCAGHDLREMRANPGRQHYEAVFRQCARLMTAIVRLPKPVIARVHGVATAAGCQLVASCDLAVATADARFATPGVNIGLFCS
ncbi:MAG: enoyl-CoA hydratase-related protein, partial [Stellaceae bacterium]